MRFGRRGTTRAVESEMLVADRLPAFVETVGRMPVQCLLFADDGRRTVFAAFALDLDDLISLNTAMSELPEHPPVSPASWLDRYLDRWHHGRFAGWRLHREHAGLGQDLAVHADLGARPVRNVHPTAGVHVAGSYVRYDAGRATGGHRVTVDRDRRCAELLYRRSVEAGLPLDEITSLAPPPTCLGISAPPLTAPPPPEPVPPTPAPAAVEPVLTGDDTERLRAVVAAAVGRSMALPARSQRRHPSMLQPT